MKIQTRYVPVKYSSKDFPHMGNLVTVAKDRYIQAATPVKVTATAVWGMFCAIVMSIAWSMMIPIAVVSSIIMAGATYVVARSTWSRVGRDAPNGLGRRLDDEINGIVKTYKRLLEMKEMLPEGSGYMARIEQFGALSHQLLSEVERLPRLEGHMNFRKVLNEVQVRMKALVDAGNDLVDLISTRRAENTLESIKFLGVDEYADQVSVEMMTFRALVAGDESEKADPIPPRPRKNPFRVDRFPDPEDLLRELDGLSSD